MNKISAILVVILLSTGLYVWMSYNRLYNTKTDVVESWQQLQVMYNRRNALISLLAEVIKRHGKQNQNLEQTVIKARMATHKISMIPAYRDNKLMGKFREAQNNLSYVLTQIIFFANNYADIRTDPDYIAIINKFAVTSKSIVIARREYNQTVKQYNETIKRFPTSLVANLFNFKPCAYSTVYPHVKEHELFSPQQTNYINTLKQNEPLFI